MFGTRFGWLGTFSPIYGYSSVTSLFVVKLWSVSIEEHPSGYPAGFVVCAIVCVLAAVATVCIK